MTSSSMSKQPSDETNSLQTTTSSNHFNKILIANAWHCINIGDIAHTPGLLNLLYASMPEVDVTLWPVPTIRPGKEREIDPTVRKMLQTGFPKLTLIKAGDAYQCPPDPTRS